MVRLAPLALGLCATSASSTDELKFGDGVLQFAFDPVSLSLTNVTARHGSRTQGFILGEPRSLWQLNATNCSEVLPKGSQVDGQSTCTSCTHRLVTDATTRTLELLWYGVQGLPGGARVDVAVNISMTSAHPGRAHFSATVTKQPGSSLLCIQFLALPNLPSLVGARYSGSEWVFNPRAFGQTTEFVGAGAQQEEEDMNEAVAIRASGEGNWMPNVRLIQCPCPIIVRPWLATISCSSYAAESDCPPSNSLDWWWRHAGRQHNAVDGSMDKIICQRKRSSRRSLRWSTRSDWLPAADDHTHGPLPKHNRPGCGFDSPFMTISIYMDLSFFQLFVNPAVVLHDLTAMVATLACRGASGCEVAARQQEPSRQLRSRVHPTLSGGGRILRRRLVGRKSDLSIVGSV